MRSKRLGFLCAAAFLASVTACGSTEGGTSVLAPVLQEQGARFVWRGSYDGFVLGAAEPSFDEQTVTEYPNRAAYLLTLSDPRVAAVSSFRADGLAMHWIYTAGEAEIDLGF